MEVKPVVPFEPIQLETLPTGPNWVAQIKWDGVRMLTYYDGQEVQLWNRRCHARSEQYPELLDIQSYCSAKSVILDGEIIAFDGIKPTFHEIMKRESLRKKQSIERAIAQTPVTYMIFDILMCNGKWLLDQPLSARQQVLHEVIRPSTQFQLTPNMPDGNQLYEVMKQHGMEGVVMKDLNTTYALGGKDKRWIKKKIFHDLHAIIGGVTLRAGIVNAILLGLFDREGRFMYIGHAGTGKLSRAEWRDLTTRVEPLVIAQKPFVNEPERSKEAIWIKPTFTAKIQYMEWTAGGTMRHPSIQAFTQVALAGCTFDQLG
ncbi:ATP-dependent DNA ligase [Paenibacillus roseipurpureus]|uniref:DNA ligase (ATP) n=1 Tax=Paenibacillus roseopurpureus TaxID=2918901 RepID=A0AA96RJL3_9BACL|nr:RNA ligase family protein [Paenibacillus sp. MBLB1832]WNR43910.1 RNA ligase family protein [Paenibacillus sp. MBLB1832]